MLGAVLNFDLDAYALPRRALVEQALARLLPEQDPAPLWESMRYSLLSGGKRVRALLCLAAAEAVRNGGLSKLDADSVAMPCACAIEMIHAMSLIHDDLPCMDDDDFRRGKPTNHKVFGEATALLAGDALLVFATETLLSKTPAGVDRDAVIDVAIELARATGPGGMVGGQVADCIATGMLPVASAAPADAATTLDGIHKRKTGALLRFSVWSGARLMGADKTLLQILSEYGEVLGLAFQIADDLLDTTGDLATLGKTPGKDQAAGKLTWVSVFGIERAQEKLRELEARGSSLLQKSQLPASATAALAALLSFAIERKS